MTTSFLGFSKKPNATLTVAGVEPRHAALEPYSMTEPKSLAKFGRSILTLDGVEGVTAVAVTGRDVGPSNARKDGRKFNLHYRRADGKNGWVPLTAEEYRAITAGALVTIVRDPVAAPAAAEPTATEPTPAAEPVTEPSAKRAKREKATAE